MVGPAGGSAVLSFILREEPTELWRSERGQFSAEPFQGPQSSYDQRRDLEPGYWLGRALAGSGPSWHLRVGYSG